VQYSDPRFLINLIHEIDNLRHQLATLNFPAINLWYYTGEGEQGWGDQISNERIGVAPSIALEKMRSGEV